MHRPVSPPPAEPLDAGRPIWAVIPAAGHGARFGGDTPKQYLHVADRPLILHALETLLSHQQVAGAVVALAGDDAHWPRLVLPAGKPVLTCLGGATRAASVRNALRALPGGDDGLVLVHDAARPNLRADDLQQLIDAARACVDGAILAAPVRDTLKRADGRCRIAATQSRDGLWRALTPQAFRRSLLLRALDAAADAGVEVTDEAMAVERLGLHPMMVPGREDNIKVTTADDLAVVEALLARP